MEINVAFDLIEITEGLDSRDTPRVQSKRKIATLNFTESNFTAAQETFALISRSIHKAGLHIE